MTRSSERRRWAAATAQGRLAVAACAAAGLLTVTACSGTTTSAPPAAAAPTPSPSTSVRELTPALSSQLDKAVQQTLKQAGVPGVTVGLWLPGKGTYIRSFGVADKGTGAAMSENLHMRIGSETKTFTVTGILRLVDAGRLGLDDPISKYVDDVPNGDRITLRQLAEMRSGLFSYSQDPDFDEAFMSDPDRKFTPQQLLDYAFKHPPLFAPGQKFNYSNTNLILLGLVIEKVSGQPLGDFLQQQVIEPAGLRNTLFPKGTEFPEPHAQGYTMQTPNGEVANATNWDPSWAWAAGAIISDLQDLRRWAPILAKGTLLKPSTQRQRLRMLPTGYPGTAYGLGIFTTNGWIGHNGSLPGYESVTVYLPSAKATLVILTNADFLYKGAENSTLFAKAVTRIVTPDNVYALPPSAPSAASPSPSA
ncbi:serine hydrolase domain-containing protein [Streptomyces sp. NPDC058572]|uniref:serine hydrolase domain-containing protein n=1 Tax=Streptomyces sp. NPDC058572 TaxID=3346546 RepID=UPI0036575984